MERKSSHIVLAARQIVRNLAWEKIYLCVCKCLSDTGGDKKIIKSEEKGNIRQSGRLVFIQIKKKAHSKDCGSEKRPHVEDKQSI